MKKEINNSIEVSEVTAYEKPSKPTVLRPYLHSAELFGAAREVVIEHAGQEYRLRMTRQGKLILTK
ncbi:MAG: hemin uptake protein HemP [Methylococcaceae bacterium]|nr:hemin uptake protein HemP [Methylococcaceae bacterium]